MPHRIFYLRYLVCLKRHPIYFGPILPFILIHELSHYLMIKLIFNKYCRDIEFRFNITGASIASHYEYKPLINKYKKNIPFTYNLRIILVSLAPLVPFSLFLYLFPLNVTQTISNPSIWGYTLLIWKFYGVSMLFPSISDWSTSIDEVKSIYRVYSGEVKCFNRF